MSDQTQHLEPDDLATFEAEVAALWRAGAEPPAPLPAGLRDRLVDDAEAFFEDEQPAATLSLAAWAGWGIALAAAAAVVVLLLNPPAGEPVGEPATFAALVRDAGVEPAVLGVASADPAYAAAEVEVAWDEATQAGVLRVRGLPANDPAQGQYQLWIVDATRPTDAGRNRVDGGVFDVDASAADADGWVSVPVDAKLPVGDAAGFAVTYEPPGGSVVSELGDRLLLITS